MTTPTNTAQTTEFTIRMAKAFALVCPATHAAKLATFGMIPGMAAIAVSWKDRIAAIVTEDDLVQEGVTLAEVIDSIEYYTATTPVVSEERVFQTAFVRYLGIGGKGWLLIADGYRAGPAR